MTEFTFSPKTRAILETFYKINPAILFRKGHIVRTTSPTSDILGVATIAEDIPSQFAVYDLSKLLGIISLYEEPKLLLDENKTLTIKGKDRRKFIYTLAAERMVITLPDEDIDFPNPILSFNMPVVELKSLKKNVAIANLSEVAFVADGKTLSIKGIDSKNPTGDQYVSTVQDTDKSFNVVFTASKIADLMEIDYEVSVSQRIVRFKSQTLEYFLSPELGSKYD